MTNKRDRSDDDLPEELTCAITRTMFRDPVLVFDSGHTYERSAILSHFDRKSTDPITSLALSDTRVVTNWAVRKGVQAYLDSHPDVTPDGWDSRELVSPQPRNDERYMLNLLRGMSSTLRKRWPLNERQEDWTGVEFENGRVVGLDLHSTKLSSNSFLRTALWAHLKLCPALTRLWLDGNELTSVPAEIGQLTSLTHLYLHDNQLTSLPAEILQLTSLTELCLGYNHLESLPAEIGQLASLSKLDLGDNELTSVAAELWQLTSLRTLGLRANQLTKLPAEIGQLTSLVRLDLSDNRLTILPLEIGQLTALKELNLCDNELASGQLTSLEHARHKALLARK